MKRLGLRVLLDCFLIYVLTAALIWPLFKLKYMDNYPSIESTFISDARFLAENWPHPRWQPLWYCGTRFDYIYPPALRYGTAVLVKLIPPMVSARAYHLYTAIFYCLGIVGVYLLVWAGSRSRGSAWLAATATALASPAFLFMKHFRAGTPILEPIRLGVMVRYGEGPHMTAVAVLGLALAASFLALPKWKPGMTALAAALCALVVSNNFYGATALATFFPVLCWAIYVTHQDKMVWLRGIAIALLAYGLTSFWLTKSYIEVTVTNLKLVSARGTTWSLYLLIAVALVYASITWWKAAGRKELAYLVFVIGGAVFFCLNVLGQHYFKFRVAGEPERLVPELDLAIILLCAELLRRLWYVKKWWKIARIVAIVIVFASLMPSKRYVRRAYTLYPKAGDPKGRIEYQLSEWVAMNYPGRRSLPTGTVRFWWNAWFSEAQIGGGSEQGVLNQRSVELQWQVLQGGRADLSIAWLQAMGVDLVIAHTKESAEWYHDWAMPEKFNGVLPVVHDTGKGDRIYKVPRRYDGLARVVDAQKVRNLEWPDNLEDLPRIQAYADLMEKGPESPTATRWEGTDILHVKAKVREGEAIVVQQSWDPYWRPYLNGRLLNTYKDVMGQTVVEAPPGDHNIRMVFEMPSGNKLGWALTGMTGLIIAALLAAEFRRRGVTS